jgi:hypothetical protein
VALCSLIGGDFNPEDGGDIFSKLLVNPLILYIIFKDKCLARESVNILTLIYMYTSITLCNSCSHGGEYIDCDLGCDIV